MVFRAFRRAVVVMREFINFGRAEEAQLDKLIAREQAKLEIAKKLSDEADEAFSKMQMDMLKQSVEDMEGVQNVFKRHEDVLKSELKKLSEDMPEAPEPPKPPSAPPK